jgi:radical SAM protein with 4Fe4S-binding SPASM domain
LGIYTDAKRKGLLITLFTNGTLVTPRIADHLAEWRPFAVEITLYGRTQATYERVTGVPGSHARCTRGIELLLERGVPLRLKTMLLTVNHHELQDMEAYADSLGVAFRFDPMVNPQLDRSLAPVQYRLSPQAIVQNDFAVPNRQRAWQEYWDRLRDVRADPRYLYTCGAGVSTCHIDPYGGLSPCIVSRGRQYDLQEGSFHEGWHSFLNEVRFERAPEGYTCNECRLLSLCGQCPGWAQLEGEEAVGRCGFLCEVGHLRASALESISLGEKSSVQSELSA